MIKLILRWFLYLIGALILQASLIPNIAIAGISPDLPFVTFFLFALQFGVTPSIYLGFFLGLGLDLYCPYVLGQSALAKTITGAFAGLFNERMMRTDPITRLVILLVAFIVHDIIFLLAHATEGDFGVRLVRELVYKTLPRAVYSAALAALVYLWFTYIRPLRNK